MIYNQKSDKLSNPLQLINRASEDAFLFRSYSIKLSTIGGTPPIMWSIEGNLPDGLEFANGIISGTPTKVGRWEHIIIRAVDRVGSSAHLDDLSISVHPPLSIANNSSKIATVGQHYDAIFDLFGAIGDVSFSSVGSPLPNGLELSSGSISGTPTIEGIWSNISIRVSDSKGQTATSDPFSISVAKPISISGSYLQSGIVGAAYSSKITASGGRGPLNWSIKSGLLPDGLSLSDGTISGTPIKAGTWRFVVRVSDQDGRYEDTGEFSIHIDFQSIRQPATGEYFPPSISTAGWFYNASTATYYVMWFGKKIGPIESGKGSYTYDGATYYRGRLDTRYHQFGVYRTIP